jgi:hypothetical protein
VGARDWEEEWGSGGNLGAVLSPPAAAQLRRRAPLRARQVPRTPRRAPRLHLPQGAACLASLPSLFHQFNGEFHPIEFFHVK